MCADPRGIYQAPPSQSRELWDHGDVKKIVVLLDSLGLGVELLGSRDLLLWEILGNGREVVLLHWHVQVLSVVSLSSPCCRECVPGQQGRLEQVSQPVGSSLLWQKSVFPISWKLRQWPCSQRGL